MGNKGSWLELYHAALLEVDPTLLTERIAQAYRVMQLRLEELARNGADRGEVADLHDAIRNLRVIERQQVSRLNNQPL